MTIATAAFENKVLSLPDALPGSPSDQVVAFWASQRPEMAAGLGDAFSSGSLSPSEQAVAIAVFERLAKDTEVDVRRALAEHVKSSPMLPRDIALRLAADIEVVALPILQTSPVLTDADLVAIIAAGSPAKSRTIAGRAVLSEMVSGALVDTGDRSVVEILLANDGAEISCTSYRSVLAAFAQDPAIQELLIERPSLPFAVRELLVTLVSKALQARIIERHGLPARLVEQLSRHGHERSLLQTLAGLRSGQEIEAAVTRLASKNALSPTLLLRILSAGLFEHFGAAIGLLARVPAARAQNALRKAGTPALLKLYERAKLPEHLEPAFQAVLEVILERRRTGHTGTDPEVEQRLVNDLVCAYRKLSPGSLESVICQLGQMTADNPDALRL